MLSRIRGRVSYASVAATLALVFAMSGGAYAASRYVITSTKQIKPSVLKQLKGAAGAAGAKGAAGATGATGPAGATGATGATGPAGQAVEGKEGKEGAKGEKGAAGSPWPGGGVLPAKATETGSFAYQDPANEAGGNVFISLSFSIQLKSELESTQVEIVKEGQTGTHCTGSAAEPTAPEEFLCVYIAKEPEGGDVASYNIKNPATGTVSAARAGAILGVALRGEEGVKVFLYGTWAVTG
jgi:hypothetical protein